MKDILRAGIAVPTLTPADVTGNTEKIAEYIKSAAREGVTILSFPELCLTGYTCGELFHTDLLLSRAEQALCLLAGATPEGMIVAVGAPLLIDGQVYNTAVFLSGGKIIGAAPKLLPHGGMRDESRYFTPGTALNGTVLHTLNCFTFPVSTSLLLRAADGATVGTVLGEDAASPLSHASVLALGGAEIILNLSAAPALAGNRKQRLNALLTQASAIKVAYLYAAAGVGESVADQLYCGQGLIALEEDILAENNAVADSDYLLIADIDLGRIRYDRRHDRSFADAALCYGTKDTVEEIPLPFPLSTSDGKRLRISRLPFVPDSKPLRDAHCLEIFEIQATALARRLNVVGGKLTVGISGGLDSTLALLVAVRAMDQLNLPHTNITAVTMPCFGTSDDTLQNALALMEKLGVTAMTIPIGDAVLQHFKDIGHDANDYSVTYENSQARERTQVLMDLTNKRGGIVLGTGDLSEMALGWCTYNGDHMSMYGVNCGVPKTLIRFIIEAIVDQSLLPDAKDVLYRIIDTPISPELLPPDAVGRIAQKTEDIVGPYALHDFFLYYTVRYGYRPAKLYALARIAFADIFENDTIKKWLTVFTKRFFTQQFKRNCVPDGIKVSAVGLSPRGDFTMPSDAAADDWLSDIADL